MVPFSELVYLPDEDRYEETGRTPAGVRTLSISGSQGGRHLCRREPVRGDAERVPGPAPHALRVHGLRFRDLAILEAGLMRQRREYHAQKSAE
jgi:hypothetical protein